MLQVLLMLLIYSKHSLSSTCNPSSIAYYQVTFEGLWTKAHFPKVYPESRPKAEWASLIGNKIFVS